MPASTTLVHLQVSRFLNRMMGMPIDVQVSFCCAVQSNATEVLQ